MRHYREASNEPTLHCPNCSHEFRLTESLAAPLIEETRRHFQQQLAKKDAEISQKLDAVRREREQLAEAREQIEDRVAERLVAERGQIASAEAKKAREATAAELQDKAAETAERDDSLVVLTEQFLLDVLTEENLERIRDLVFWIRGVVPNICDQLFGAPASLPRDVLDRLRPSVFDFLRRRGHLGSNTSLNEFDENTLEMLRAEICLQGGTCVEGIVEGAGISEEEVVGNQNVER